MKAKYLKLDCNPCGESILKNAADGNLVHAYIVGNTVQCISKTPVSLEIRTQHYKYDRDCNKWVYQDSLTPPPVSY